MNLLILVIVLIVALPLILVCLGFFMLIVSLSQNRNQGTALYMAQELRQTLERMEKRVESLEDILIATKPKEGQAND